MAKNAFLVMSVVLGIALRESAKYLNRTIFAIHQNRAPGLSCATTINVMCEDMSRMVAGAHLLSIAALLIVRMEFVAKLRKNHGNAIWIVIVAAVAFVGLVPAGGMVRNICIPSFISFYVPNPIYTRSFA